MTHESDLDFVAQIRHAVELGNPWALDELIEETCGTDAELVGIVSQVVAEEYRRRLTTMSPADMEKLYRQFYLEPTDANKDWLLGEMIEGIWFEKEMTRYTSGSDREKHKEDQ